MKSPINSLLALFLFLWLCVACQNRPVDLPTLTPVSTPNPTLQAIREGQNPPYYGGIAAWGEQVYFGHGQKLFWLDVQNPAQPILQDSLTIPNPITAIHLEGDQAHLFITAPDFNAPALADGWQQVDLSDPARPQLTTFFDAPFTLYQALTYRNTAYLAPGTSELFRLDLTDAAAPRTLAPLTGFDGSVLALAIYDHYLLVESASCFRTCNGTLTIFDASQPQQLQQISQFSHYGSFRTLLVHPPFVTLAGTAILTLDLTNPETPKPVGELAVWEYVFDAVLDKTNTWLYAATGGGLITFDLSQLTQPQKVDQQLPNLLLTHIALDGHLLAALSPEDGVLLYTLDTAAAPHEVARFQLAVNQDD
jgi:hypothetical protein